jgi:hypothetical protein
VLRISDQYDISPHLRQMIEQFIATHLLEAHNAITIYHYAVLNNAANLEAAALAAIKYASSPSPLALQRRCSLSASC